MANWNNYFNSGKNQTRLVTEKLTYVNLNKEIFSFPGYLFNFLKHIYWLGICFIACYCLSYISLKLGVVDKEAVTVVKIFVSLGIILYFSDIFSDLFTAIKYYRINKKKIGAKLNTKSLLSSLKCFDNFVVEVKLEKEFYLLACDWEITDINFYYSGSTIIGSFLSYYLLVSVLNYQAFLSKYNNLKAKHAKKITNKQNLKKERKLCSERVYNNMLKELLELKNKTEDVK